MFTKHILSYLPKTQTLAAGAFALFGVIAVGYGTGIAFGAIDVPHALAWSCSLSANPTTITAGDTAMLSWSTHDLTSFSIDNGIGAVTPIGSGSVTVSPSVTTTYTGTGTSNDGDVHCTVTIKVNTPPPPPPAPACTLTVSASSIASGDSTTLSWTTTNATSATLDNGIGAVTSLASGSTSVSPSSNTTYTLAVASASASVSCSVSVTVTKVIHGCTDPSATNYNSAATVDDGSCTYPPPPAPTCTLSALPSTIVSGDISVLSWTTTHAVSFAIDNGIGSLSPVPAGSATTSPAVTTTYTGTATGTDGTKVHCTTKVTVTPPPPSAPTCTLSALPPAITSGATSTLAWTTKNADSFAIDNGIGSTTPVLSGSTTVAPTATTTYTGTAIGPGGLAHCTTKVAVTLPPPPPPPAPTCTLSASPASIASGNTSVLSWVTTNADSFAIDNGIGSTTPVSSGTTTTAALTADTTFTGTAINAAGAAITCVTTVSVTTGGGGGEGPSCSLAVNPTSIIAGDSATLSWSGANISSVFIDNGIGTTTNTTGSMNVSPAVGTYTYTGTFNATNGQTLTCDATLAVTSGGGGGGGCTSNCGGGGGGGGTPPPTITLAALPHVSAQPFAAYLYLSQIPYTGLDLGPAGTVVYWVVLVVLALVFTYIVLFIIAPLINRSLRTFGSRVLAILNTRETAVPPLATAAAAPSPAPAAIRQAVQEAPPETPRGYSSYEGFKSFAHNGALSVEDIVRGLSQKRHHTPAATQIQEPASAPKTEPVYENTEPVYEHVEPITSDRPVPLAASPDVRGFVMALIEGDRAGVFAGLRQHVRGGGAPEQLLSRAVCLVDDAYRSRIDGTPCDPDVARLTARLSTAMLETIVAALATAIDASYSAGITGAKLALTRALTTLGA